MSIRLHIFLLGIVLFLAIEGKPVANNKLIERINVLLNVTEFEKKFNAVLQAYVINDPNLSIFQSKITSFVNQFFSFKTLRPHLVEIYQELYTLSDVNGLIKFYSSSLGKKLVEKESKAEVRLTQLIKSQLEKQMPQILAWFQNELINNQSN